MAAVKSDQPITPAEFGALLDRAGPFETDPVLAVALSGGSDSMALALLAYEWATSRHGSVIALTVDHGLRPESAQEAEQLRGWCHALGIKHQTLRWTPPAGLTSVQNAAREARYQLLADYCRQHHILHLLTGHQLEDQAETFFFRLARGSGMAGLACMPAVSCLSGIRLVRPLLPIPKARLVATLMVYKHPWIEDPSNQTSLYTRNHIRHLLAASGHAEAYASSAFHLASQFGVFRNLLENKLASYLTDSVFILPEGYAILQHDTFLTLPHEIGVHALSQLVMTLSGTAYPPRSEKLHRLYKELGAPLPSARRSFAGLLFHYRPAGKQWLVYREPDALQGALTVQSGAEILWDQRFRAGWEGKKDMAMTVRGLGPEGIARLQEYKEPIITKKQYRMPKMALASLPSFWHLEEVVSVPHIHYQHHNYRHVRFNARFFPAKSLAGGTFFGMNRDVSQNITKDS